MIIRYENNVVSYEPPTVALVENNNNSTVTNLINLLCYPPFSSHKNVASMLNCPF